MPRCLALANIRSLRRTLSLPRLTPVRAAALLAGAVLVQMLPALPGTLVSSVLVTIFGCLLFVRGCDRAVVWFVLGFTWTMLRADAVLQARLPDEWHGRDFVASGVVVGIPRALEGSARFELRIERLEYAGETVNWRGLARLNWYESPPEIEPCSQWKLRVRLRAPRGLVNPGGYDSERAAVQRGFAATGYVRVAQVSEQLQASGRFCLDRWRQSIVQSIHQQLGAGSAGSLLSALSVGDQNAINEADWQTLRATGIGHLIAISGLHVGMFAAFGAWIARRLWKCWPRMTLYLPAALLEAPIAMTCALAYGMLAGMGLPTLRTLLMIAIALLARYARRATSVPQTLAVAAVFIHVWDPLSVLSPGFWLSFIGVAILVSMTTPIGDERPAWRDMPRVQLILSIALLPLTIWFFGQGSIVGPLANLLAVPWISFVVVPVTVSASLFVTWMPMIGIPLLQLAEALLMPLWGLMQHMAAWPAAQRYFAAAPVWAFVLAVCGVAWSLMPRGVPLRSLGLLLTLPMLVPPITRLDDGEFETWFFDVGQGLSVFVRTRDHSLLYDAGPRYPNGFDAGDAIVIPSLRALGVTQLDRMLISHGDGDHAGGAGSVELAFPNARVQSGEPERLAIAARPCVAETMRWNGVEFRTLAISNHPAANSNDRSCVMVVVGKYGSLLLTGDATDRIDARIAAQIGEVVRPLVLSVPHHGSKTSSSRAFLDALVPDYGIVSAGYRNRFNHPHPDVIQRYAEREIRLFNTAEEGFLYLKFGEERMGPEGGRALDPRWWRSR
jgi:competence protein ComEC